MAVGGVSLAEATLPQVGPLWSFPQVEARQWIAEEMTLEVLPGNSFEGRL